MAPQSDQAPPKDSPDAVPVTDGPAATTLGPDGKVTVTAAQANAGSLAAPSPDASPAAPAQVPGGRVLAPGDKPKGDRVRLAPVPPLESVTLPPLEDGGKGFIIPAGGIEVDADTAQRAHEAAVAAGFRLQEL